MTGGTSRLHLLCACGLLLLAGPATGPPAAAQPVAAGVEGAAGSPQGALWPGAPPDPATSGTGASDFSPHSSAWNGTARLLEELRRNGAQLELAEELDWRTVRGAGLLLLDPLRQIDLQELRRHIQQGGRALLGVERGPARALLAQLGLRLELAAPVATLTFHGRRELPFALPAVEHPLTRGDPFVLANHPSNIARGGRPLLQYAGPETGTLLAELELGQGSLLVLADPSVLINNMLEFPGNRQLAANLAAWLCAGRGQPGGSTERCRLLVLHGAFAQRAGWRDDLASLIAGGRRQLARLDEQLSFSGSILWVLSALLLGACLLQLLRLLPPGAEGRRGPAAEPLPWVTGELAPPADLPSRVASLAGTGQGADLRLALAMLAEQAEPLLRRHLGEGPPSRRIAAFYRRIGSPPGGETALAGLLTSLAAAPAREDLYAPSARPCSPAELEELAARWHQLRHRLEQRHLPRTAEKE